MKTPKILIVEQEDLHTREKLSECIEACYEGEVVSLNDGYEALLKVRQESFDLIISNFMLPGSDGIKILIAAKKKNFKSMVIIMDRIENVRVTRKIDALGGLFIAKPLDWKQIRISMEKVFLAGGSLE